MLLLHRVLPAQAVITGMQTALALGAPNPDLVTVEARRAAAATPSVGDGDDSAARVVSLPERPTFAPVPAEDPRPLPSVTAYDELLRRRCPTADPIVTGAAGEDPEPERAI